MECDSDHARIEKAKKRFSAPINHPHDWAQLIRYAGKDKFSVIETDQTHFLDFNSLLKSKYQFKKKNVAGQLFLFRDAKWFRYKRCNKDLVYYKTSLKEDAVFECLNLSRRNAVSNPLPTIPKAYNNDLPVTIEKKKDLLSLLQLIPELNHDFYKQLKTKENLNDPIVSDEDDE